MKYVSNTETARRYGPPCRQPIVPIRISGSDVPLNKKAKRMFLWFDLVFKELTPLYWKNDLKERQLDTWGYMCRPTTGSSGSVTVSNASKHAWGLAVDLDADENVRGTRAVASEIWRKGEKAVRMLEKTCFTWGGRFGTPDPHHFEIAQTRSWALKHLDRKGRPRKWYAKKIGWKGPTSTV